MSASNWDEAVNFSEKQPSDVDFIRLCVCMGVTSQHHWFTTDHSTHVVSDMPLMDAISSKSTALQSPFELNGFIFISIVALPTYQKIIIDDIHG